MIEKNQIYVLSLVIIVISIMFQVNLDKNVPQSSIHRPLLFCLYTNDMVKAVDVEVVLFGDDAASLSQQIRYGCYMRK